MRRIRDEKRRNDLRPSSKAAREVESELIAAARAGDRRALERLVREAAAPAWRYSRGFCRNDEDARDLVQDVLATLLRSLGSFRGDSALSSWTFTVARRACAKRRRREARFVPLAAEGAGEVHERPDPTPSPARQLDRRRLRAALEEAIAALPAAHREVVVLRDVEGLSAAEAARVLGIGERAVKSRLHRARTTLRERLAPFVRGSDAPARPLTCPDTARLMSEYLEGELDAATCARMQRHVAACPACGGVCRTLREVLGACRAYAGQRLPAEVGQAVRDAVRDLAHG